MAIVRYGPADSGVEIGARAEQVFFPRQYLRFDRHRWVRTTAATGRRRSLSGTGQEELLLPAVVGVAEGAGGG
ncbi:hypothetical protein [Streptomyces camelliae]|uniref:Uncharacterized protein n=1 Tax=Streptomyces camelliae TaxID=3004093 RepID=A0ABY7P809_9ACTN|nr:hypothetical protein [Streptomyces sp. HUAS 2-6]WBO65695.1 hypothetical protein O1G22_24200 [Streptomyces sp. HUAS 2-6]